MFGNIDFSISDVHEMLYIKPKSMDGGPFTESDIKDAKFKEEKLATNFIQKLQRLDLITVLPGQTPFPSHP